jgi:hypothetical protein
MQKRLTAPLAVLLSFTCGCYTTRHVQNVTPVAQPTTEEGVVVTANDGQKVRIDPNTQLRFQRSDGTFTPWFRVSELVGSQEGVFRQGTADGMYWADIADVEAKNFSGGKTLGVIALSAAIVAVVIVAVIGAEGGGGGGGGRGTVKPAGGGGGGKLGGWNSKGGGSAGSNGGGVNSGGSVNNGGGVNGGIYIGPHYHNHYYSAGPNPTVIRPEQQLLGAANFAIPDPSLAQPMFHEETERQAKAQLVASVEGSTVGDQFNPAAAASVSAAGVVRFGNTVEFGGGFRQMMPTQLSGPEALGFLRFNLHLNLDQRHLFAVPLGLDAGVGFDGNSLLYKVNAGLRLQVTPTVSVGAYPFNPTYFENNTGFGWGFPSSAELSFSF